MALASKPAPCPKACLVDKISEAECHVSIHTTRTVSQLDAEQLKVYSSHDGQLLNEVLFESVCFARKARRNPKLSGRLKAHSAQYPRPFQRIQLYNNQEVANNLSNDGPLPTSPNI